MRKRDGRKYCITGTFPLFDFIISRYRILSQEGRQRPPRGHVSRKPSFWSFAFGASAGEQDVGFHCRPAAVRPTEPVLDPNRLRHSAYFLSFQGRQWTYPSFHLLHSAGWSRGDARRKITTRVIKQSSVMTKRSAYSATRPNLKGSRVNSSEPRSAPIGVTTKDNPRKNKARRKTTACRVKTDR